MSAVVAVLPEGAELAPGYRVVELLSRGQALDVYEVYSEWHWCTCIAKTVRPDRTEARVRDRLLNEARLLSELRHPHLVRALDLVEGPAPVLILETLYGDTLEELIEDRARRMPAAELVQLGLHLTAALAALHRHGVAHLDVRPANIVHRGGAAVLIDLSIAREPGRVRRGYGTGGYLAPEQAAGGQAGFAADVWGLGITLFQAATGLLPDRDPDTGAVAPVATLRRLPRALAGLIDDCLAVRADDRPDLVAVRRRLEALEPSEPFSP